MIILDSNKNKKLSMSIIVEGIEQEKLDFKFIIEKDGIEYGFPAELDGNKVKLKIPALVNVIKELDSGRYPAKIEVSAVTEGNKGFYMRPWEDTVKIEVAPEVSVSLDESEEEPTENISVQIEEDIDEEIKESGKTVFDIFKEK